jgi:hypothetical protein
MASSDEPKFPTLSTVPLVGMAVNAALAALKIIRSPG